MVIGVAGWDLQLFTCQSLKEKRSVVRRLKHRLRDRANVSVAETGHHDLWQRAELTAAVAATDRDRAEEVLEAVDRLMASEAAGIGRIIDSYRTFY